MAMRFAVAKLKSMSPYSQSKFIDPVEHPKLKGESHPDYEERVWRERLNTNADGFVQIPPMAFKNCLSEMAKFSSIQIPGRGKETYTKHFEAGVLVTDPLVLSVKKADVPCERLHVPSDGKRGGSKRVVKNFGVIQQWSGTVKFIVVDPAITKPVFEQHLSDAGSFIGLGRFRPRNNGYYGRFSVESVEWSE